MRCLIKWGQAVLTCVFWTAGKVLQTHFLVVHLTSIFFSVSVFTPNIICLFLKLLMCFRAEHQRARTGTIKDFPRPCSSVQLFPTLILQMWARRRAGKVCHLCGDLTPQPFFFYPRTPCCLVCLLVSCGFILPVLSLPFSHKNESDCVILKTAEPVLYWGSGDRPAGSAAVMQHRPIRSSRQTWNKPRLSLFSSKLAMRYLLRLQDSEDLPSRLTPKVSQFTHFHNRL